MIGKLIYNLLSDHGDLTALVPATKIFPYVLNENTDLPAIVYVIESIEPEYTKDGWALDSANFLVIAISTDYAGLQSIATEVRAALEMERGTVEGITIQHIHITSISEEYNSEVDVFVNRMSFNVNVINY
jgi:hypothetical protein